MVVRIVLLLLFLLIPGQVSSSTGKSFNVSYGLGPNLDSLKEQYRKISSYLGAEVGKNLVIEKTSRNNYMLVYRRRGDRSSTYAVARKHASLLRRLGISTAITAEKNNPVVFGEAASPQAAQTVSLVVIDDPAKQKTGKDAPETAVYLQAEEGDKLVPLSAESRSVEIEQAIEAFIKDLRRKGVISGEEQTGWMVYDLTERKSLAAINGEQRFQAASMIKPFVALAFFHRVKQGELIYGPKSRRNMELMIQRSNNRATNWVMRMAGGPALCEKILTTHYSDIFKNTIITEYIPPGGRTYKNVAPPADYVRFLQALWDDRLPYSKEIRRLMSLPGRDRLFENTPIPQGTLVYNKTGSTAFLCGDMGILAPRDETGRRHPYVLVGIIQRSSRPHNYGSWMHSRGDVIRQVSTLVYQEMKKQYRLL